MLSTYAENMDTTLNNNLKGKPKIAICQDYISFGGRITVLIDIIYLLNKIDIVPDLITYKMSVSKSEIHRKYGFNIRFNVIQLKRNIFKKFDELNKLFFNYRINRYKNIYDVFFESNNTSCFFPSGKVISYVHYPRIDRVLKKSSIHGKDHEYSVKARFVKYLDKSIASFFYKLAPVAFDQDYLFNSLFTKNVFLQYYLYQIDQNRTKVVYPPTGEGQISDKLDKKPKTVVTLGRFSAYKRQFEQILIAERLPDFTFYIIGFKDPSGKYFNKCKKYIELNQLKNVKLFTDLKLEEVNGILNFSQFFLHTTQNEPFGITTVQAIRRGCIPIVPNNGGQMEIVNIEELRFSDISQAVDILINFNFRKISDYYRALNSNIVLFSSSSFQKNLEEIVLNRLKNGTKRMDESRKS